MTSAEAPFARSFVGILVFLGDQYCTRDSAWAAEGVEDDPRILVAHGQSTPEVTIISWRMKTEESRADPEISAAQPHGASMTSRPVRPFLLDRRRLLPSFRNDRA
jgi:hypothetical protein